MESNKCLICLQCHHQLNDGHSHQVQFITSIFINTPGGALTTTISIINAMLRSKASIICHADGQVASAGTLIFFAGESYVVYPYSHFMLHDGSSGSIGKINENVKNSIATSNLVRQLCFDAYHPVFTEEEIELILEGRDYYCDAEEMMNRINALNEEKEEKEDKTFVVGDNVRVKNDKLKSYDDTGEIINTDKYPVVSIEFKNESVKRLNIKNLELA